MPMLYEEAEDLQVGDYVRGDHNDLYYKITELRQSPDHWHPIFVLHVLDVDHDYVAYPLASDITNLAMHYSIISRSRWTWLF